ncbi:hypothetical protein N0K08_17310 [Acidovorax sp. Be4]|uniref:Uncharacterized protein n=1 Tax=Acidovorax bellezanensis TaxID=2976702 RepID=A0ABT2PRJ0_9BURK|nr:hypothetical protein [Acidovorax sp. Be4]MCT9812404.1 hypothetical protein [Acidovorax sp. Be4]
MSVSTLDQVDKLSNHSRALCNTGCESFVLICEISRGSGVTGKLGVAGGGSADVVLQACNAASISGTGSLKIAKRLGKVMGVVLLGACMFEQRAGFLRYFGLGQLGLGGDMRGQ